MASTAAVARPSAGHRCRVRAPPGRGCRAGLVVEAKSAPPPGLPRDLGPG